MKSWLWLPATLATVLVVALPISHAAQMLLIAISIYLILKTQSLIDYGCGRQLSLFDRLAWFTCWPGMRANDFFLAQESTPAPTTRSWWFVGFKMLLGAMILLVAVPATAAWNPLAAGWAALVGIAFVFHFGVLHLSALYWNSHQRNVEPIMQAPILATSLSDFWGRRWNLAFRDFSHRFVFRPLTKRWNSRVATWACFGFSGVIHDLAISLPAGGGYGLPTAYFAWQGLGVSLERRLVQRGVPVRGGWLGWCYTCLFVVPGAFLLFHPPFIRSIVLPLLGQ